ncbi:hypothetical protein F2P56_035634 [Juglans regia]|uniref:Uncharacterized protein LOC108990662 n=2 Tax=Juglans regia TaxID=51240 RepID=A0A2I4ELF0_JUGRE|nr:uncharacterized protein LOC108990662 [Juglans regia]KAF5443039.1 hypothetical protein F2P56_035634 [Juglans regia]
MKGITKGVTVSRGGIRVNHLLFADDCILFARAKTEEWLRLQELLLIYEKASGQFLNKDKTSVFFSSNSRGEDKEKIMELGGAVIKGSYEKYLGLPPVVGKSKYNTFRSIKERVWKKINNWKNVFLSAVGKEDSRSMAARVFKEKYFKIVPLTEAKLGNRPSYIWRSVCGALNLLKDGLRWRVGNGTNIKIWGQKWLPTPSSFCVQAPCTILDQEAKVSELITSGEWNEPFIKSIFYKGEAEHIWSLPISRMEAEDKLIWGYTKKGVFAVNSAYQMEMKRRETATGECSNGREGENIWKVLWNLNIPRKAKFFLWKAAKELLAIRNSLYKKGIIKEQPCPICKKEAETAVHVLWSYPAAADFWSDLILVIQKWRTNEPDMPSLLDRL